MKGLEIIPTYHLPPFTSPSTQNYKQNPSKRILFNQFNSLSTGNFSTLGSITINIVNQTLQIQALCHSTQKLRRPFD